MPTYADFGGWVISTIAGWIVVTADNGAAGPDQRLRGVRTPELGSSTAERDVNQSIIGLHCIIHSLPLALKGPSSQ